MRVEERAQIVVSLTTDELEDLDERPGPDLTHIDLTLLRSPVVVRAVAGIAVATLVLAWPDRTERILARLIGLAIVLVAGTAVWAALRVRPRRAVEASAAAAFVLAGSALVIAPTGSEVGLARFVGVGILVLAARDLSSAFAGPGTGRSWRVTRSFALVLTGGLLLTFPAEIFALVITVAALAWIALSLIVVSSTLDRRAGGAAVQVDSARLIGEWLAARPKSADDRTVLYDKILFEGPATARRVIRFATLMAFASVIASMGVITDSTAVVIGAMLIAPLMTPLMGMAISLVMGWPNRLARSFIIALAGILLAIGVGLVLGLAVPSIVDTSTNTQITARAAPTILDLITALAAGAAGAYGLSRPDVSDSLPGVAIAISLVPPLSVVGIAYANGDWDSGNGALLLFATNMVAILLMGGVTFVVTGVTPIRQVAENQHRIRTAMAAVAGLGAFVVGALFVNGAQIATDLIEQSTAEAAVSGWLEDYPRHGLVTVDVDGDTITARIVGPSEGAPGASSLARSLGESFDRMIVVDLRLVVEEREVATTRAAE